jgi:hypothetical protein
MERQFEKKHARELKEARLVHIAQKRQRKEDEARPGSLLEIDEEQQSLVHSAALYAQKWDLTRCLILCGTPQEQASAQSSSSVDDDAQTLADLRETSNDNVLMAAARELYRAYTILTRTGLVLKLPERLVHDAASFLAAYAARKDGLSVKGVVRCMKRQQPQQLSQAARQAAQVALREFNALRQSAALSVAVLFYTARRQGNFRPLNEVYQSLPVDVLKAEHFADWTQGGPLIKTKQCAKAMAQVKECFPDLAKNPGLPEHTNTKVAIAEASLAGTAAPSDNVSVQNYIVHVTHSLQLPPVATACLQTLVQHSSDCTLEQEALPLRTASFTYFIALVGQTMQKLAAQSQPKKSRKRPRLINALRTHEKRKKSAFEIQTPVETETISSMDGVLSSIAEEEEAYRMQRMWSVWKDQMPWWRSLPEISKAIQVPAHKIRHHYQRKIHPIRHALLKQLSEAKTDSTPLSSVLLPHIVLAAPLLKDDS